MFLVWVLLGILGNCLVGGLIWPLMDYEDKRIYEWYREAPLPFIMKPLILFCWPVGLYFRLRAG